MMFPVRMVTGGAGQASFCVFPGLSSVLDWHAALHALFSGGEIKGHTDPNRQSVKLGAANRMEPTQGNRHYLSLYCILNLISSRGCEEVREPHPCTSGLQVRRHQGRAHFFHHTCGRRHALSTAPGTCSAHLSWAPFIIPSVLSSFSGMATVGPFAGHLVALLHLGEKSSSPRSSHPLLGICLYPIILTASLVTLQTIGSQEMELL